MLNDFVFPSDVEYQKIINIFDHTLIDSIGNKLSNLMTLEKNDTENIIKVKRQLLNETKVAQPAILLQSILNFYKYSRVKGNIQIENLFGPSLGEITSLVVADSINFEEGARLVYNRGKFMQESCPIGKGSMLNIIGDSELSIRLIEKFKDNLHDQKQFIDISSINSKRLVVVSGKTDLIEKCMQYLKENSIACKKLPVSAAFHSILMENAQESFSNYLENNNIFFKFPKFNVLSTITTSDLNVYQNIEVQRFDQDVKKLLIKQLRFSVSLLECVRHNLNKGIDIYDVNKRKLIDNDDYI